MMLKLPLQGASDVCMVSIPPVDEPVNLLIDSSARASFTNTDRHHEEMKGLLQNAAPGVDFESMMEDLMEEASRRYGKSQVLVLGVAPGSFEGHPEGFCLSLAVIAEGESPQTRQGKVGPLAKVVWKHLRATPGKRRNHICSMRSFRLDGEVVSSMWRWTISFQTS